MTDSQPNRSDETADLPRSQAPTPPSAASIEQPGDEVGPYKLLSLVGEGGFGVVWIAERRAPFSQRVALKFLKPGMDSKAVLARFEQERQALALMDHPHVARVFDGGMTPAGRPYFAMELVKGEPINVFCDRNRLTVRERLRLFVQVCDAVQHAHMKGIIHRDLKPSNILVSSEGDRPNAKVIDFGVAKAIAQRLTEHTVFTETGQMIGTPEYMSPEQAEPGATDIDTRSDVYSLGVILYELLAGATPFDSRELRSKAYREIQRIIREVDPPAPSTRLSTIATRDADTAAQIAAQRGERIATLANLLKSELEWIPLKAMRKDRRERYGSAADLARDVEAYLDGKPIVAAPESTTYRLRKFVRRNRAKVAASAAIAASVVTGLVASLILLREANIQRARAEERERDARELLEFQHQQLATIDPERAGYLVFGEIARQVRNHEIEGGKSPREAHETLKPVAALLQTLNAADITRSFVNEEILERSVRIADEVQTDRPLVHADLLLTIGRTALGFDRADFARRQVERALEIRTRLLGPGDERTLEARDLLLRTHLDDKAATRIDEARENLKALSALLGDSDPRAFAARRTLVAILSRAGQRSAALEQATALVAANRRAVGASAALVDDLCALGDLEREGGQLAEAERTLREARSMLDACNPTPPRTLRSKVLANLGLVLTAEGQPPSRAREGITLLTEATEIDERLQGGAGTASFDSRSDLALRLAAPPFDDWVGAEQLLDRSRIEGESLEFQPASYFLALNDLAFVRFYRPDATDREASLGLAQQAYERYAERTGGSDEHLPALIKNIASMHMALGRARDAERIVRIAIDRLLASGIKSGDFKALLLTCDLAIAVAAQDRWSEAVEILAGALADADRDQLPETSDARWITSCKVLRFLEQWRDRSSPVDIDQRILDAKRRVDALKSLRAKCPEPKSLDIDEPDHTVTVASGSAERSP